MKRSRGFTLIELMMVVAVLGVISSIAIPTFQKAIFRSRAAERKVILNTVYRGIQDIFVRRGRLETAAGVELPALSGAANPPGVPGVAKRAFDFTMANWSELVIVNGTTIEGNVYYSYQFAIVDTDAESSIWTYAAGDLDGDGKVSEKSMKWYRAKGGIFRLDPKDVIPADGMEDNPSF